MRAGREVILAAGAVNSPHLLQLSGIGAPRCLPSTASRSCIALPGVGENLQDHLQLRMIYKVRAPTLNSALTACIGRAGMGLEYALLRRGPMTMAPSQMGGFTRSIAGIATPNLQFHVQPLCLDKFGEPLHAFPPSPRPCAICGREPRPRAG